MRQGCQDLTNWTVHGRVKQFVVVDMHQPLDAQGRRSRLGATHRPELSFLQGLVIIRRPLFPALQNVWGCPPDSDGLAVRNRQGGPSAIELRRVLHLHEDMLYAHVIQVVPQPPTHISGVAAEQHDRDPALFRLCMALFAPALLILPSRGIGPLETGRIAKQLSCCFSRCRRNPTRASAKTNCTCGTSAHATLFCTAPPLGAQLFDKIPTVASTDRSRALANLPDGGRRVQAPESLRRATCRCPRELRLDPR
mmetsp:Transcript_59903/g.128535  ORF Transcript_59903/g.128535 Transcript_59903/m.128535 type:complete len:252 (-) Transcript_59903:310-1065(-)